MQDKCSCQTLTSGAAWMEGMVAADKMLGLGLRKPFHAVRLPLQQRTSKLHI